jgi:hypothetical protein
MSIAVGEATAPPSNRSPSVGLTLVDSMVL